MEVWEMEPKIEEKAAITVMGLKYRGKNENLEVHALWEQFAARQDEIKRPAEPGVSYAVIHNLDTTSGKFDYVAGIAVKSRTALPKDMVKVGVPEGVYAVFDCTLPELANTYTQIEAWLLSSGYQRAAHMDIECYGESFEPSQDMFEMEVWVPLEGANR
jgi:predicted transcriptional regulator YdeE